MRTPSEATAAVAQLLLYRCENLGRRSASDSLFNLGKKTFINVHATSMVLFVFRSAKVIFGTN